MLVFIIFALLITGAVTMLYPFLLMVSGSTKSALDTPEAKIIPEFLTSDKQLWQKHVEGLFNESLEMMQQTFYSDATAFNVVMPPEDPNALYAGKWLEFIKNTDLSPYNFTIGYLQAPVTRGVLPHALREFKDEMIERYDGDINALNRDLGTEFVGWNSFFIQRESFLLRREKPSDSPFDLAFQEFKTRQPYSNRYYFSPEGFYRHYLKTQYSKDIEEYNKTHDTSYKSYHDVHLDRRLPEGPGRTDKEREDWENFVRMILNLLWIRADENATQSYRDFLRAKYRTIEGLNRNYETDYASFEDVPAIKEPPAGGLKLSDWDAFLQGWKDPDTEELHILPAKTIYIHSTELTFRDKLKETYDTIEDLNTELGNSFDNWLQVLPPQEDYQYFEFKDNTSSLRWEFCVRNYITVVDYMVLHGRGILNTCIYCVLAVAGALLVNPLGAYALSRYKPPSAYKILLFLMLTMAFPPMVTQIPVFLMLREFNMLNTFFALILPGLANGYSIFLLKGFFDSLPQELYESAEIDGAGEFRIFWQITMSLSKPILAVIGLQAFNMAYSNFMFALLICQDERMWTLMVWMYQLQQRSGQGVVFASLLIAAIPTFLIFAFCQKIIMRGIIVPVEK
jgi:multiple sugar transport system permease protein